jgi:transcriptional regulator GlxA family with amidase domain
MENESSDAALTIEAIARASGASTSTLRRMFLTHLKMTPVEYLQDLRLGRARDLLAKTTLGVKEVAARVGYADALYFSKAFSRRHGCPPSRLTQKAARH